MATIAPRGLLFSGSQAAIVQGTRTPPSHGGNRGSNPLGGTYFGAQASAREMVQGDQGGDGRAESSVSLRPEISSNDLPVVSIRKMRVMISASTVVPATQ